MMWGYDGGPAWSGFGWFGGIFMILWWVVAIGGIVALVRWIAVSSGGSHESCRRGKHESAGKDAAMDILKERYARGEIGKEEFEEKKKDLGS